MPLFSKKKRNNAANPTPIAVNTPQPVTLASGRLAPVFLRMYRWVISANLAADVYQIESGEPSFAGQPFPARGRYSQWMSAISGKVIEEYRAAYAEAFQANALAKVFSANGTGVSGVYCMAENGDTDFSWYEVRAERIPNDSARSMQCILYFRRLRDGNDYGNELQKNPKTVEADASLDWDQPRVRQILSNRGEITFEYNIAQDYLILHHGGIDPQPKRYDRYLARIEKQSDWRICHESVPTVCRLFRDAISGKAGEAVIQYRTNTDYGMPFRYYWLSCMPLEETATPTWVIGALRDIDESYRKTREQQEMTAQISTLIDTLFTEIYLIDTEKDSIIRVRRTEDGYKGDDKPRKFSSRIKAQIERGIIAPESADAYLAWTEKGFLSRKTARGSWKMEGQLNLPGSMEYRWYEETIAPIKDKPNTFLQIRLDITDTHKIRQQEFELQEELYLSNYNQSMLDILADLVEFRNVESGLHISRVRMLTKILLQDIAKRSPQYSLGPRKIEMYCRAATTHDIGKITIPDAILNKPTRLTPEEFQTIKTHTTSGAKIIDQMNMPGEEDLKALCRDIALHHHERWDGSGYPEQLKGDDISIGAQAVSLADSYDALVSERCYKKAFSPETAVEMILAGKCGCFNPRLLESLKACAQQMRLVYELDEIDESNVE